MALRQSLQKPLIVEPAPGHDHTHTVVFLHRFPPDTSDEDLRRKVLSEKLTEDRKTLRHQFPAVRWVFPHAKLHPGAEQGKTPWRGLSPEDITAVELEDSKVPYVTQIILREARLLGSLDRVIIGGQGETAVAAHEAITNFPEISNSQDQEPDGVQVFIQDHLPGPWTEPSQLQLAGFVGMHSPNDVTTRDQRGYWLATQFGSRKKVNECMVANTRHHFIHGGFKAPGHPGDGVRIDDFAAFLTSVGVVRADLLSVTYQPMPKKAGPVQAPGLRDEKASKLQNELSERDKYLELIKKQKAETKQVRERTLARIKDDQIERKLREERQRQQRTRQQAEESEDNKKKESPAKIEDDQADARRRRVLGFSQ